MVELKEKLNVSIKISKNTKKKLDNYKIYDRETYNNTIKRAVEGKVREGK